MGDLSGASKSFLHNVRQDERFIRLMNELEIPDIPPFHPSRKQKEGFWEYWSGQRDGVSAILNKLKGTEVSNE